MGRPFASPRVVAVPPLFVHSQPEPVRKCCRRHRPPSCLWRSGASVRIGQHYLVLMALPRPPNPASFLMQFATGFLLCSLHTLQRVGQSTRPAFTPLVACRDKRRSTHLPRVNACADGSLRTHLHERNRVGVSLAVATPGNVILRLMNLLL